MASRLGAVAVTTNAEQSPCHPAPKLTAAHARCTTARARLSLLPETMPLPCLQAAMTMLQVHVPRTWMTFPRTASPRHMCSLRPPRLDARPGPPPGPAAGHPDQDQGLAQPWAVPVLTPSTLQCGPLRQTANLTSTTAVCRCPDKAAV